MRKISRVHFDYVKEFRSDPLRKVLLLADLNFFNQAKLAS